MHWVAPSSLRRRPPGPETPVDLDYFAGLAFRHDGALLQQDCVIAVLLDLAHGMRHQQDGLSRLLEVSMRSKHFCWNAYRPPPEFRPPAEFGVDLRGHRKRQPHIHARRVLLDRSIDEIANVGKLDDAALALAHLTLGIPISRPLSRMFSRPVSSW